MDHLAQDLTIALEESESCGPVSIVNGAKWGMRRRTRSAGNLRKHAKYQIHVPSINCHILDMYLKTHQAENHTDEDSSSNSEVRIEKHKSKMVSFHQSDSDDMSISIAVAKALNQKSLRMKHPIHGFFRGM